MKPVLYIITAMSLALISGCATVQGVGNDLSSAGTAISKSAGKVRSKL